LARAQTLGVIHHDIKPDDTLTHGDVFAGGCPCGRITPVRSVGHMKTPMRRYSALLAGPLTSVLAVVALVEFATGDRAALEHRP